MQTYLWVITCLIYSMYDCQTMCDYVWLHDIKFISLLNYVCKVGVTKYMLHI